MSSSEDAKVFEAWHQLVPIKGSTNNQNRDARFLIQLQLTRNKRKYNQQLYKIFTVNLWGYSPIELRYRNPKEMSDIDKPILKCIELLNKWYLFHVTDPTFELLAISMSCSEKTLHIVAFYKFRHPNDLSTIGDSDQSLILHQDEPDEPSSSSSPEDILQVETEIGASSPPRKKKTVRLTHPHLQLRCRRFSDCISKGKNNYQSEFEQVNSSFEAMMLQAQQWIGQNSQHISRLIGTCCLQTSISNHIVVWFLT